jgi:hypothetical protein
MTGKFEEADRRTDGQKNRGRKMGEDAFRWPCPSAPGKKKPGFSEKPGFCVTPMSGTAAG